MGFAEYGEYDAIGLAELVERGEVSAEELLDEAVARTESINPTLGAIVIPMFDEAREALREGLPHGPLRGVPYLLKDLALLYAGVRTTHGCRLFADHVPDHDSEMVARYKRAGLVIFGKSASPEFGLTTTTESILFGATRNPWNLEHSTGGSSGGAGAAVAAGILPAAHASDGGGSIRIPASCCALVGLKPSRGRIPFGPDLGEGWSGMSTMHAVSRTVRDTAVLLDVVDGADVGAPYAAPPKERPYLEEVDRDLAPLRIALISETFNGMSTHPDCERAVHEAGKLLESVGHHVEESTLKVDVNALAGASRNIMSGNVASLLEDRAALLGRTLSEDDVEPFTWQSVQAARQSSTLDYARAVRGIHAVGRAIARFLEEFDLILTPTMATPPEKLGVAALNNPDQGQLIRSALSSCGYTQVFNASGHPAISLPLAWNEAGLPIGIQFVAPMGDEARLIRLAGQLEKAQPWAQRRPPERID